MAKLVTLSGNYSPGGAWLKPYHENETMSGWWTDLKKAVTGGAKLIAGTDDKTETKTNNTALWVTVAVMGTVTFGLAVNTLKKTRRQRRYR